MHVCMHICIYCYMYKYTYYNLYIVYIYTLRIRLFIGSDPLLNDISSDMTPPLEVKSKRAKRLRESNNNNSSSSVGVGGSSIGVGVVKDDGSTTARSG